MADRPDILILCGGQASRLGGIAKPLAPLAGRPLIERVLERVLERLPGGARILISANTRLEDYQHYASEVIDDGIYPERGPLAGIQAGLSICISDDLLCVPGDAPRLPADLLPRLRAARGNAVVAYAHDGAGPQPLCCLLARSTLPDLRAYLDAGGSTPRDWFARQDAVAARFADAPGWGWSLNTPEEWRVAEQALTLARLTP